MKNKKIILFALVAAMQLFIPLQMIWHQETIINSGTVFRFKTAPVDPNDPFRGKYINLDFEQRQIHIDDVKNWETNETVFATIGNDKAGFAKIVSIAKRKPVNAAYLKLKIGYISNYNNENKISLDFPFDRFYMNEYKAPHAELQYSESNKEIKNNTYALVAIQDGEAVLKDVIINNASITKLNP